MVLFSVVKNSKGLILAFLAAFFFFSLVVKSVYPQALACTLPTDVKKAAKGATVKVTKDCQLAADVVVDKSITIDGNGKKIDGANSFAIDIYAPNVTVKNLTITNGGYLGIRVNDPSENVSIIGNSITDPDKYGIEIDGEANALIDDNEISGAPDYGIFLNGSSTAKISGNTISKSSTAIFVAKNASIDNIDDFPADNSFSDNEKGNCDGAGFDKDELEEKNACPDEGAATKTPTPTKKTNATATPTKDPKSTNSPTPSKNGCQALGSNFVCASQSKKELEGQSCAYTDKSKKQNASCQAVNSNTYCYECDVENGDIKNVCDAAKKTENKTKYKGYLEPRCGKGSAGKFNEAKARKGEFEKEYYDVYQCGDEEVEIHVAAGDEQTCGKAPWDLSVKKGTPTPTLDPLLLCPASTNTCEKTSNCADLNPGSKRNEKGDFACTQDNPTGAGMFCCTKSGTSPTATKTPTSTPKAGATKTPTPKPGANCSDPDALEDGCETDETKTCINDNAVKDWDDADTSHCAASGRYCNAKVKFTLTKAECTGASSTATPTKKLTKASTPDTSVVCLEDNPKTEIKFTVNGLSESEQDRSCGDKKVSDPSSRCCRSTMQCIDKFGDGFTCRAFQNGINAGGDGFGNCSSLPLCNN